MRALVVAALCACSSSTAQPSDALGSDADAALVDAQSDAGIAITTFRNPLNGGPDPFLTYDGTEYLLATTQGDRIALWHARSLARLAVVPPTTIWADTDTTRNHAMWAPALYRFDGRWYVYYTADDGTDEHHRLYVVESAADDPLGPYHFKAKLEPPGAMGLFAIDPAILEQNGTRYMVWSGAGSEGHNLIYIAPMSDPWTIAGARTYLAASGGCAEVREAPAILQHDGTSFLVYSTCDTGKPDYQLWALRIPMTADPLVATNWSQISHALFTRSDAAGAWGPGSCSFFHSPDGTQDWLAYHAKNTSQYTYDFRTTRAQRIDWTTGTSVEPALGAPTRVDTTLELPAGDPGDGSVFLDDDGSVDPATPIAATPSIAFTANWTAYSTCGVQCFHGTDHGATDPAAAATIQFTGTQIALLAVRDAGNGRATFSIDGQPPTIADFYAPIRQGEQAIYVSPALAPGPHTLVIQPTGTHAPASAGNAISIDRFEIY